MTSKIQVNEQGVELAYIDSGSPITSGSYRTLIAVHGFGWSSHIFQKALPEARRKGIRLIALNRRDYPGSTPFSQDELAVIKDPHVDYDKFSNFMYDRALELIGFIHHIIKKLVLPTHADGTRLISVLGWSSGVFYTSSVMACLNDADLPAPLKQTAKEYISSFILEDPPIHACGIGLGALEPSWFSGLAGAVDANDFAKAVKALNEGVSGWYQPIGIHSPGTADKERFALSNEHPIRPSTVEAAPDADYLMKASCPSAIMTDAHIWHLGTELGVVRSIALYAIDKAGRMKKGEERVRFPFSKMSQEDLLADKKLAWLWCENAPWFCAYNAHIHREEYGFERGEEDMKMLAVPEANHFFHWEDPQRFIDIVLPLM